MRIVDQKLVKLSECVFKIGSAVSSWETSEDKASNTEEWKADFEYVKMDYLHAKQNLVEYCCDRYLQWKVE